MPDITIDSLTVTYSGKTVFTGFSCAIKHGSFTSIIGASGAGKTSLVNAIMGLIPCEGSIVFSEPPLFSAVFQEDRLCGGMSAFRNVALCADPTLGKKELTQAFHAVGLGDCTGKRVCLLSGGMKRRVAILRALSAQHNILILDEPFKGLDAATKSQVMSYVKEKTSSDTVLMITHDAEEAEFFASDILTLK